MFYVKDLSYGPLLPSFRPAALSDVTPEIIDRVVTAARRYNTECLALGIEPDTVVGSRHIIAAVLGLKS